MGVVATTPIMHQQQALAMLPVPQIPLAGAPRQDTTNTPITVPAQTTTMQPTPPQTPAMAHTPPQLPHQLQTHPVALQALRHHRRHRNRQVHRRHLRAEIEDS